MLLHNTLSFLLQTAAVLLQQDLIPLCNIRFRFYHMIILYHHIALHGIIPRIIYVISALLFQPVIIIQIPGILFF